MTRLSVAVSVMALLVLSALADAAGPMLTEWGEHVTSANAWRGYPRPQMVRESWTCLNGEWDYAVTAITNTLGRPEKWDGKIRVPFAIESVLSGVGRPLEPHEYLWYTREIELDPRPGERILLHFGAVDFRAIVYLGHDEVAATPHEGGQLPFTVDLTPFARKGANTLTVLVWDPTNEFIQSRGKQSIVKETGRYRCVSGIWQTVWLETVPDRHIADYAVTTDIDAGTVTFTFNVDGVRYGDTEEGQVRIVAECEPRNTQDARKGDPVHSFRPGETVTVKLPSPVRLWSPESPNLYGFTARFGTDSVKGYFGMRKFEKRRDAKNVLRFFLNNRPCYLMGVLDQGWWPDGLLTPPSEEAMAFDIQTLKDCGFNMMRKHIKVEPLRYYALCDRLGMIVIQDMPSSSTQWKDPYIWTSVKGYGLYREELKGLIDHLRKVPSIVMWAPYNEGWGQHDRNLTHTTLDFVKRYDLTRLVDGPSGNDDFEGGVVLDPFAKPRTVWTSHLPEGVCEAADVVDRHRYRGPDMPPVNDRRVSFLGEFGGLGHAVEGHMWQAFSQAATRKDKGTSWGYGGMDDTKTRKGLEAAYLGLMEKLGALAAKGLSGSVYTQTTDMEFEINGLLTYDRKVLKFNPAVLKAVHERVIAAAMEAAMKGRTP